MLSRLTGTGSLAAERRWLSSPAVAIGFWIFVPFVVIIALGLLFRNELRPFVEVNLTNLHAAWTIFRAQGFDSWKPMLRAFELSRQDPGADLYKTIFFGENLRFQYPPSSLLAFQVLVPLGISSLVKLNVLNFIVFLANAAGLGFLAFRLMETQQDARTSKAVPAMPPWTAAVLAFVAAFVFYPLLRAQMLGQIQVWIDALFTGSVICWLLNRRLLAGVLIGLACTLKPQMGLVLLWALLWRQWSFCFGAAAVGAVAGVLSLWLFGLQNHLSYLGTLSFLAERGEAFFTNNSINGILNAYFSPADPLHWDIGQHTPYVPIVARGTMIASFAFAALMLAMPLLFWRRQPGLLDFCIAAIFTVIGSPIAWEHHYGILMPIYIIALREALLLRESPSRTLSIGLLTLSWVLTANFNPFLNLAAGTPVQFVMAHCFIGGLLLLGCLYLLLAQDREKTPALSEA